MSHGTEQTAVTLDDEQALRRATVRSLASAAACDLIAALRAEDGKQLAELVMGAGRHLDRAEAEILRAPLG